jgi:hypothetical protein
MELKKLSKTKYVFAILIVSFFFLSFFAYRFYINLQEVVSDAIPHHLLATSKRFLVPISDLARVIPWLENSLSKVSILKGMRLLNSIDNGVIGKTLLTRGIEANYGKLFDKSFPEQMECLRNAIIHNNSNIPKLFMENLASKTLVLSEFEEDFLGLKMSKKQLCLNTKLSKNELEAILSQCPDIKKTAFSRTTFSKQLQTHIINFLK